MAGYVKTNADYVKTTGRAYSWITFELLIGSRNQGHRMQKPNQTQARECP
jgi:hypothetical protein